MNMQITPLSTLLIISKLLGGQWLLAISMHEISLIQDTTQ